MSNNYPEDTVAIATVRGVPNVLVLRRRLTVNAGYEHHDWAHTATETGYSCSNDDQVVVQEILDPIPLSDPS